MWNEVLMLIVAGSLFRQDFCKIFGSDWLMPRWIWKKVTSSYHFSELYHHLPLVALCCLLLSWEKESIFHQYWHLKSLNHHRTKDMQKRMKKFLIPLCSWACVDLSVSLRLPQQRHTPSNVAATTNTTFTSNFEIYYVDEEISHLNCHYCLLVAALASLICTV